MTRCLTCHEQIEWSWTHDRWKHALYAVERAADHQARAPQWVKLRCPQCGQETEVRPGSSGSCTGNQRHSVAVMVEVG